MQRCFSIGGSVCSVETVTQFLDRRFKHNNVFLDRTVCASVGYGKHQCQERAAAAENNVRQRRNTDWRFLPGLYVLSFGNDKHQRQESAAAEK
ncbi:unnamed protein product [Macrosiphum euphorbiae]|uniref:Uncharacterized protein n=1 Tax=Macrosiphum euphorbiae TaxID=13131 RepID=A0AAV0XRK3_9HEMI|nr:unnamed protein product [Macrosiphum euphorbiae]